MATKGLDLDRLRSEGELDISPRRKAWHQEQSDESTKYWLEEDAKYFLHLSLSTPCLDVLARCEGAWLGSAIFPLAAMLVRDDLDVAPDRALGHYTQEKNLVACATALATIEVMEEERLLENARAPGDYALERMRAMNRDEWTHLRFDPLSDEYMPGDFRARSTTP